MNPSEKQPKMPKGARRESNKGAPGMEREDGPEEQQSEDGMGTPEGHDPAQSGMGRSTMGKRSGPSRMGSSAMDPRSAQGGMGSSTTGSPGRQGKQQGKGGMPAARLGQTQISQHAAMGGTPPPRLGAMPGVGTGQPGGGMGSGTGQPGQGIVGQGGPAAGQPPTGPQTPVPPTRRCATMDVHRRLLREVPGYAERRAAIETLVAARARSRSAGRAAPYRIDVVVHVVWNTAAQNVSDAQIQSQIDVINQDFRRLNPDWTNTPAVWQPLVSDSQIE